MCTGHSPAYTSKRLLGQAESDYLLGFECHGCSERTLGAVDEGCNKGHAALGRRANLAL